MQEMQLKSWCLLPLKEDMWRFIIVALLHLCTLKISLKFLMSKLIILINYITIIQSERQSRSSFSKTQDLWNFEILWKIMTIQQK